MRELLKKKKAQGMVEYILIVALVAILIIGALKLFGGKVKKGFHDAANKVDSAVEEGNRGSDSAF